MVLHGFVTIAQSINTMKDIKIQCEYYMKRRLQVVKGSFRTIIPKELCIDLKLKPTDRLDWSLKTVNGKRVLQVEVVD